MRRLPERSTPEAIQHGAVEHAVVQADFLVAGVNGDIGDHTKRRVAPDLQMSVEFGGALADLRGTDRTAAKFLHDGRDLAGGDALDIHLGQRQIESLFAAETFFQGAGIELHVAALAGSRS